MAQQYVKFRGLKKSFGDTKILHGIDLDIDEGEFVVLVGPSGCGKSTLLRMIAGLETISEGELSIDGHVVNRVHASDRGIAMVFQSYALYPHMTVQENLTFSLRMRKTAPDIIAERLKIASDILKLTPMLDRLPAQLSGGQRQRVAMGRALVREPTVFLFDEPLSNLDAKLRVEMRAEIRALHQRLKTTTIYVTHDQIEAMTMADKVVVMNDGRIEQMGAPLDIYDRPNTLFVAEFLGSPSMNLIEGEVSSGDGGQVFKVGGGDVTIPLPPGLTLKPGQQIIFGIRPEHITIEASGLGLPIELTMVEPAGWETHVHASLSDRPLRIISTKRVESAVGDRVHANVAVERAHLFDVASGQRLN